MIKGGLSNLDDSQYFKINIRKCFHSYENDNNETIKKQATGKCANCNQLIRY